MGRMGAAITEARRAQEVDRLSLVSQSQLAWVLYFAGQNDQGIAICKKALELDPNFYVARRYLGLHYEQKKMYPQAIAEFQQAVALGGGSLLMKSHLGHAYAVAGDRANAQVILNEMQSRAAQTYVPAYLAALIYAGLGDKDRAFAELEKAYETRDEFLVYLKIDPRLEPLRADPRFGSLAQRLGFP
jgi:tetratricopeptide (TPR) repeat protein